LKKSRGRAARASSAKRDDLVLRLYVAGAAPHSTRALANVRAMCDQHLGERYQLEVVDVLRHPARALDEGILVTPTLVKVAPEPVSTLIGDLSDRMLVLSTLGLSARGTDD
jgi:circadian clock protein KaiB